MNITALSAIGTAILAVVGTHPALALLTGLLVVGNIVVAVGCIVFAFGWAVLTLHDWWCRRQRRQQKVAP